MVTYVTICSKGGCCITSITYFLNLTGYDYFLLASSKGERKMILQLCTDCYRVRLTVDTFQCHLISSATEGLYLDSEKRDVMMARLNNLIFILLMWSHLHHTYLPMYCSIEWMLLVLACSNNRNNTTLVWEKPMSEGVNYICYQHTTQSGKMDGGKYFEQMQTECP